MGSTDRGTIRVVAGLTVLGVGIGLVVVAGSHALTLSRDPVSIALGGVAPVVLGAGTAVGGAWLLRSDLPSRSLTRMLAWWLFAMVVAALMGTTIVLYERSHGVILADAFYVITSTVTAGSTGGLVIGYFDARSRRYTDALAAEREQLEVLNRVVRHDIQNDMNVVIGWLDILEPHVEPAGRDAYDRVDSTSRHVVELTQIARDYVAVVVGDTDPDLQPVPLAPTIENELQTRRAAFPDADIVVDGHLPTVRVQGTDMLGSVFRNLVNNAVQHNDTDRPRVELTVQVTEDDTVRVHVADNGPGVPDHQKASIFGKGDRGLDSPGTGIGLYLVDTLVTEYGGTVDVTDNDPRGAVFTVELPLHETEHATVTGQAALAD